MTQTTKNIMKWALVAIVVKVAIIAVVGFGISQGEIVRRAASNQSGQVDNPTGKIPATPGEQPWMVALVESYEDNAYDGQFCGGSLITPDLVLTAAHCLEGYQSPQDIDVVIGRHVLSSDDGERITASAVYMHEGYDNYTDGEDNDIAVVRLERPSRVGTPIALINQRNAQVDDPGTLARATGWGVFGDNSDYAPDELHGVNLPVVAQAVCESTYGDDLTPDAICAGLAQGGKDTCSGDSGGPLVANDSNGTPIQIGIVSWGDECGAPGNYGVYARLTEYDGWINSIRNGSLSPSDLSQYEGEEEGVWDWFWGDESDGGDDDWYDDEESGWFDNEDAEWFDGEGDFEDDWSYDESEDEWFFFDEEDDSSDDGWFFDDEQSDEW